MIRKISNSDIILTNLKHIYPRRTIYSNYIIVPNYCLLNIPLYKICKHIVIKINNIELLRMCAFILMKQYEKLMF